MASWKENAPSGAGDKYRLQAGGSSTIDEENALSCKELAVAGPNNLGMHVQTFRRTALCCIFNFLIH
jgi:hypothetical protein